MRSKTYKFAVGEIVANVKPLNCWGGTRHETGQFWQITKRLSGYKAKHLESGGFALNVRENIFRALTEEERAAREGM